MNKPSNADLNCLNSWPEGTVGHREEELLIAELNRLCGIYGYGRIPQLCAGIEMIWRNPETINAYEECRQNHLAMLRGEDVTHE